MTVQLPEDVENSIKAEVLSGHFASAEDAIAEAWRTFLRRKPQPQHSIGPGSIGAMHDAVDELDLAVEHAMNLRQRPWRSPASE